MKHKQKWLVGAILFACCLLILIVALLKRHRPSFEVGTVSQTTRLEWPPLPPIPNFKPWLAPTPVPSPSLNPIMSDMPADTPINSSPIPQTTRAGADMLSLKIVAPTPVEFGGIGVVDMSRLLAVHPPTSDSKEARAESISDIQRAVAVRAGAHDFVVIFDSSGLSLSGVRAVLTAAPAFDLTEEVVQQLTVQNSRKPLRNGYAVPEN